MPERTEDGTGQRPRRASGRSAARLAAVQALYQMDVAGTPPERVLDEFRRHRFADAGDGPAYARPDAAHFAAIVAGVGERAGELDDALGPTLREGWRVGRLDRVVHAILRAGAWELMCCPEVPAAVVLNEYVEVAKAFFEGREPAFVNGVLDRLARLARPDGTGGAGREPADDGG